MNVSDQRPGDGKPRFGGRRFRRLLVSMRRAFLLPWSVPRYLRRSLTVTSVTLMLLSIVTLNIVWGYPWVGMFAACLSLAAVGWTANQLFRPVIRVDIQLPLSVPAGRPFQAKMHLTNRRRVPAMDLRVGFDLVGYGTRRAGSPRWLRRDNEPAVRVSAPHSLGLLRSRSRDERTTTMCFEHRGIHPLPDVVVESFFPFYLFRVVQQIPSATSLAVTPRPLAATDAPMARTMVKTVDDFSAQYLAGESLEYSGSREYEAGVAVRRWDFRSWARLGKPIVREFQSPALQSVWLLVDTGTDAQPTSHRELERVLSCAAAVIPQWLERRVRLRMYVTSELPAEEGADTASGASTDGEALLIRLAEAQAVDSVSANQRLLQQLRLTAQKPVLLLTSRDRLPENIAGASHCRVVRVDPAETFAPASKARAARRQDRRRKEALS